MALKDELEARIYSYATSVWPPLPQGRVVPDNDSPNLTQGNRGVRLNATVLYADIAGSTTMVDTLSATRAAEYYKAYLDCAAKILKNNGGVITAYDGDRVMAMFMGDAQVKDAVTSALQLNWAVEQLINPIFDDIYKANHLTLRHTVGIDSSEILAAKIGVRLDNDVVWIGPAANYAAKLNSFDGLDSTYPIRITEQALDMLGLATFTRTSTGQSIWEGPYSNLQRGTHYRTDCNMSIA
jgi:class 3 adenylate cyclase